MQMPAVIHPKKFRFHSVVFEVVAYVPLTDEQARNVALHYVRTNEIKKSQKGKLVQLITQLAEHSLEFL